MCCNQNESEELIVGAGGAVRTILMDLSDMLIDLCQELEVGEIKINVSQDFNTGDTVFKAEVDGKKVLEVKANDFVPYFAD